MITRTEKASLEIMKIFNQYKFRTDGVGVHNLITKFLDGFAQEAFESGEHPFLDFEKWNKSEK